MAAREVTAAEVVVVIPSFPAYSRDLSAYVAPGGVLQNLAAPLSVREKPAGSDDSNCCDVERVDALPAASSPERLRAHEWRGGNLYFLGAIMALDLEIRFEQLWPALGSPSDGLAAVGIATILGYWTAGLMATDMRETDLGARYVAEARHLLYRWLQRQVLDGQHVTRRPRPFRSAAAVPAALGQPR